MVDEKNLPAKTLYEKMGFELLSRDPRGSKVVPSEWQLKEEPVTNLCMRKNITSTGPLNSFLGLLRRQAQA